MNWRAATLHSSTKAFYARHVALMNVSVRVWVWPALKGISLAGPLSVTVEMYDAYEVSGVNANETAVYCFSDSGRMFL